MPSFSAVNNLHHLAGLLCHVGAVMSASARAAQVGIKHGQGDNGKWVCGLRTLLKRSPCIVYSFGSNGETSFEQDILRATKCAHFQLPEP